jgi:SAM-dependent methyltransferase
MPPDPSRIIEAANAFLQSGVLFAASDLGVFAKLAVLGQAPAEKLAGELGLEPRAARLLLDACVASGLLEKPDGVYRNTAASSAYLVPGCPGDLSGAIRYNRDVYLAWSKLRDFACTGQPPDRPELHLGADAERTRRFVLSMHSRALAIGRAVLAQLDLRGRTKLLDVGGGPGTYSVLISRAYPEIACTVLDLPAVAAIADELIAQQGAAGRVATLPGDYRATAFPDGNDAVIFFGVLHQESPAAIRDLIRRAYLSLAPGGVIYVMDMMTDATHTAPAFSALFAVTMALTTVDGWVFSDMELRGWMEGAGFTDVAVRPLPPPMPHWLAGARKPA